MLSRYASVSQFYDYNKAAHSNQRRAWLSMRYGIDESIRTADVILVLDCDVPWINTLCKPNADAKIYHIDIDPLKQQMPVYYIDALARYRASSFNSITQLLEYMQSSTELKSKISSSSWNERWLKLEQAHKTKVESIKSLAVPKDDGAYLSPYLLSRVRHFCPDDTIFAVEAVTNTPIVADQIQASLPGSWVNCGGGGLGWSGGGALGVKLATDDDGGKKFVCQIVGGEMLKVRSRSS